MGRITQSQAQTISNKLIQKIITERVKVQKELSEYLTEQYRKTIPADVLEMYNTKKGWFQSGSVLYLRGVGITKDYQTHYMADPQPKNSSSTPVLNLKDKEATKVVHYLDQIDNLQAKKRDTETEIYNLLLSLGTWKRAAEQLPEISEYMPKEESKSLMVVPTQTREKLKCLVDSKSTKCIEKL